MTFFIANLILVGLALAAFYLRCQDHTPKKKNVTLKGLDEMEAEDRQAEADEKMLTELTLSGPFSTHDRVVWGDTPSEWPTAAEQARHPVPHRPVDPHYGDTPSEWAEAQSRPLDWSS